VSARSSRVLLVDNGFVSVGAGMVEHMFEGGMVPSDGGDARDPVPPPGPALVTCLAGIIAHY